MPVSPSARWPAPATAVVDRPHRSGWNHRTASTPWEPPESARCRRATGLSTLVRPRSGKDDQQSALGIDGQLWAQARPKCVVMGSRSRCCRLERQRFYVLVTREQAKGCTKAASTGRAAAIAEQTGQKKLALSRDPQEMHGTSTGFQQMHNPSLPSPCTTPARRSKRPLLDVSELPT